MAVNTPLTAQQTTDLNTAYTKYSDTGVAGAKTATNAGDLANFSAGLAKGWTPTKVLASSKPVQDNKAVLNNMIGSVTPAPAPAPTDNKQTQTNNLGGNNYGNLNGLIDDLKTKGWDAASIYNELNGRDYGLSGNANVNANYINDYFQYGSSFAGLSPDLQAKYKASQPIDITNNNSPEMQAAQKYASDLSKGAYDPLISDATKEKVKGFGESQIAAGQVGGFMNTQFAGGNALPVGAGTASDFAGVGGQLEQIKSAYDQNITNLQTQKASYEAQMKQAYIEYQNTGKQTAFDNAQKMFKASQDAAAQVSQLQNEKVTRLQTIQATAASQQTVQQKQLETAAPQLAQMSPDQLSQYAQQNNIPIQQVQGAAIKAYQDQRTADTLNSTQTADLLSKTAQGGSFKMGGQTYTVTGATPEMKQFQGGDGSQWISNYNHKTGQWEASKIPGTATTWTPANILQAINDIGKITDPQIQKAMADAMVKSGAPFKYDSPYTGDETGGDAGFKVDMSTAKGAGAKNNNPGNIRGADGQFLSFATGEEGFQALVKDVSAKMTGGSTHSIPDGPNKGTKLTANSTLEDMMRVYAPTADKNNPVAYAASVAKAIGAKPTDKLSTLNKTDVAIQIAKHDSGATVTKVPTGKQTAYADIRNSIDPVDRPSWDALKPDEKNNALAAALYDIDKKGITGYRGTERQKMANAVRLINPQFDETRWTEKADYIKNWATKDRSTTRNAINTVVQHLGNMFDSVGTIKNGDVQRANQLKNFMNTEVGSGDKPEMENIMNAVASEMAKVYKGGSAAPTEQEIAEQRNIMSSKLSPEQFAKVIKSSVQLMTGRLVTMRDEYHEKVGKELTDNIINPEARKALGKVSAGLAAYGGHEISPEIIDPKIDNTKLMTWKKQLNPGEILVRDESTGDIGGIDYSSYFDNQNNYLRL